MQETKRRLKRAYRTAVQASGGGALLVIRRAVGGRRIRERFKYATMGKALKAEVAVRQRLDNGQEPFAVESGPAWTNQQVLDFYEPDAKPRSLARMEELERHISGSSLAGLAAAETFPEHLRKFKRELMGRKVRKLGRVTVKKILSHLRAASRHAKTSGKIEAHVFERLDRPTRAELFPREGSKGQYIDEETFGAILAKIERPRKGDADVLRLALGFARRLGLRRGEVAYLEWSDVRRDRICLRVSKTGPREIPLTEETKRMLPPRPIRGGLVFAPPDCSDPEQLRVRIWNAWDDARKAAGFPDVRIHDNRHTRATDLFGLPGADVHAIGAMLGMSQATAALYSHRRFERAKAMLERMETVTNWPSEKSAIAKPQ